MAQSVKCPTLDFGSGHNLMVCEFEPCIRLHTYSSEAAWILSSPSPFSLSLSLSLFLKINKLT